MSNIYIGCVAYYTIILRNCGGLNYAEKLFIKSKYANASKTSSYRY